MFLAILALAAMLPLERVGAFSLAGFNVRPSQLLLALAWLLFARAWALGRVTFAWNRASFVALAGFFAACGLSLLNSENAGRTLSVLLFTLFSASSFLLLPSVLKDAAQMKRVRIAILVSATAVSMLALWQFAADMLGAPLWMTGLRAAYSRSVLGFTRVQATAAEPLYFANYLLLPIALADAWLLRASDPKAKRRLSWLLVLMCVSVFLTSSRGGWLGCAATAATLLWLERRRLREWRPLARTALIIGFSLALGLALLNSFFSTSRETVAESFLRHVTTVTDGAAYDDRAKTITQAVEAWHQHPWIGIGFGGFGPFVSPLAFAEPESGWPIVNNETLELLAETGAVGAVAFLCFLIMLFREGTASRQDESEETNAVRIACLAALAGMLVQYQTFSTLYIMHVWFTIGLLAASSRTVRS